MTNSIMTKSIHHDQGHDHLIMTLIMIMTLITTLIMTLIMSNNISVLGSCVASWGFLAQKLSNKDRNAYLQKEIHAFMHLYIKKMKNILLYNFGQGQWVSLVGLWGRGVGVGSVYEKKIEILLYNMGQGQWVSVVGLWDWVLYTKIGYPNNYYMTPAKANG